MIRESTKNRIEGLVASDLKLRDCAIKPVSLGTSRLPNASAGRRYANCGAAWNVAHSSMVTPG